MSNKPSNWAAWQRFFAARRNRQLPRLEAVQTAAPLPPSLAKSLAIFQLGESGGGTIVDQVWDSRLPGVDADYAAAMALFVAEEHRHANILAMCVRMLGGRLIRRNWTASLFVFARRLMGLRIKIMVLLAAEVVGICYYHLLATQLPHGRLRALLEEMVGDERSHLRFHCAFLRSQTQGVARRHLFRIAWRLTMLATAVVVAVDHRAAIRDMGIGMSAVWRRIWTYSLAAERLVATPVSHRGAVAPRVASAAADRVRRQPAGSIDSATLADRVIRLAGFGDRAA